MYYCCILFCVLIYFSTQTMNGLFSSSIILFSPLTIQLISSSDNLAIRFSIYLEFTTFNFLHSCGDYESFSLLGQVASPWTHQSLKFPLCPSPSTTHLIVFFLLSLSFLYLSFLNPALLFLVQFPIHLLESSTLETNH